MNRVTLALAVCLVASLSQISMAHEGHGHPDLQSGPLHYVSSPVHFGPWLFAVAVIALPAALAVRRFRSKSGTGSDK